ncbi:hypothetical protein EJD97_008728 [Solanum chilense]|uniref:Uncharacterized protein n=1 Tax=Solanum chilense TaxID=4083 RepID=A0A6N2BTW7_SOLCI|nr:hypothetical protein EJD97_008728 [Solanum chilense]
MKNTIDEVGISGFVVFPANLENSSSSRKTSLMKLEKIQQNLEEFVQQMLLSLVLGLRVKSAK